MHAQDIALTDLLLDPNNYRLQDSDVFSVVNEERYAEQGVQERTLSKLERQSLRELINSIRSNGFLEIERIVVTPYAHAEGKFLVIEGNRRVAALKSLQDDHEGGIDVPAAVVAVFDAVPCLVADDEGEAFFKEALMGIRHVGGIKEWGGYQRAKLIADLRDKHELEPGDIADRLGMSVHEVNRRYRAFKSLEQMQNDEEFGEHSGPTMYPLFHEAVSLPTLREWAGWNAETSTFNNEENRRLFYSLITPRLPDDDDADGAQKPAKISSYSEVRQLRDILPNDEARTCLFQDDKELIDAQTIAKRDEISKQWKSEVGEATTALKKVSALEVETFDEEDIATLKTLIDTANKVVGIFEKLQA